MAEHLTLVSLRRALNARAGVSEKVADDFLTALTDSIQDGLQKDDQVTISGLGTFKLQDVPARESVNVVSGERFTIAGYKKVVFAESSQQSAISNQQSAAGKQRSEDIDPIKKLGEQAEEIKDILGELNAMTASKSKKPVQVPIEAPAEVPIKPVEVQPEEKPVDVQPEEKPAEVQPEEKPAEVQPTQPTEKPETDKPEKKPFNPWLTGLITVGVFAMLLVIAYFVLRHRIVRWAEGMRSGIEQRVGDEQSANEQTIEVAIPEPEEVAEPVNPWFDDDQRTFTEFQADEIVAQDSRLAWIAKKRYNEKAYWVFIYEVNRNKVKNPDHVLPGMQLRVPKLPKELSDPTDPEVKALLERLSKKYLQ